MILKIICLCLILASHGMSAKEADQEVMPRPLTLAPDFFKYFEIDDLDALKERIKKTVEAVGLLQVSLPEALQNQTLMYTNKIAINLEALPLLKIEKEISVKPRLYKTRYTFKDIEDLVNEESETNSRELNLQNEKSSLASLGKKIERHIDSKMADYLKLDENTEEKLLLGLQIFANKSSLAVMQEKERIIARKLEADEKKASAYQQEEIFAFNHLEIGTKEAENFVKQINDQKELLKMRELQLLHAELNASYVFGETQKELSESYLSMQKSIHAQSAVALINLTILELEAKEQIAAKEASLGIEELMEWKQKLEDITSQKELWNAKTEMELDRIGHLGFALDEEKGSPNPLAALAVARYHEVQETLNLLSTLGKKLLFANALIAYTDTYLEKNLTPLETIAGNTKWAFDECCSTVDDWMHFSLFKIANVPITLMGLLEALMILAGAYFVSWFLRFMINRFLKEKNRFSHSNLFILDRLLHYLILAVGGVVALLSVGLELSSVFWVLGALSVGIGFGLQTIVNNFASSLILLFSRSIKVQDYIQLDSGEWGQVIDISVQNTILRTSEGIEIVIPNSHLISNKFLNWTMNDPYKRLHIPFGVAYGSDKDLVQEAVKEAALEVPSTINNHPYLEGPKAYLKSLSENSIDFELVVWVNMFTAKGKHGSLQSSYLWEIETALKKHNITIPFPQCDVTVKYAGEMMSQKMVMTKPS